MRERHIATVKDELTVLDMDILAVQETLLRGKLHVPVEGYTFFGSNALVATANSVRGGVGFLVKNQLVGAVRKTHLTVPGRSMWICLRLQNCTPLWLCTYYAPNDNDPGAQQDILRKLQSDLVQIPAGHDICILGDFNARIGDKGGVAGEPIPQLDNAGAMLMQFIIDNNLIAVNLQKRAMRGDPGVSPLYTNCRRQGEYTIIDYILVRRDHFAAGSFQEWKVDAPRTHDHRVVYTTVTSHRWMHRDMNNAQYAEQWMFRTLKGIGMNWNGYLNVLKPALIQWLERVAKALQEANATTRHTMLSGLVNEFETVIMQSAEQGIPKVHTSTHPKGWWNPELKRLCQAVKASQYALKRALELGADQRTLDHLVEARMNARTLYKREQRAAIRAYTEKRFATLGELRRVSPRHFYRVLNVRPPDEQPFPTTLRDDTGVEHTDEDEVSNIMHMHFEKLARDDGASNFDNAWKMHVKNELQRIKRAEEKANKRAQHDVAHVLMPMVDEAMRQCGHAAAGASGGGQSVAGPAAPPPHAPAVAPAPPPLANSAPRLQTEQEKNTAAAIFSAAVNDVEVGIQLNRLRPFKACGVDGIYNEMLVGKCRSVADKPKWEFVDHVLAVFYTLVLTLGALPSSWLKTPIHAIYKSGDRTMARNYRGIALLSVLFKIFDGVLASRLLTWGESHSVFDDEQAGFRPHRGCRDQLFVLSEVLEEARRAQSHNPAGSHAVFVAFLDVQQAYDAVWHDGLLYKLWDMGVRGAWWRLLQTLYGSMTGQLRSTSGNHVPFPVQRGLRQGSTASPVLYDLFITGLPHELRSRGLGHVYEGKEWTGMLLYADDMVLMADSHADLQRMVDVVQQHAAKWRYHFNAAKSKTMVVGQPAAIAPIRLNGTALEQVDVFRYLGVDITANGTFDRHVSNVSKAARHGFVDLIHAGVRRGGLSPFVAGNLVKTYVLPAIEYACEVVPFTTLELGAIDQLMVSLGRHVLNAHPQTSEVFVHGELGWMRESARMEMLRLRYWAHLETRGETLVGRVFQLAKLRAMQYQRVSHVPGHHAHGIVQYMRRACEMYALGAQFDQGLQHPITRQEILEHVRTVETESWRKRGVEGRSKKYMPFYMVLRGGVRVARLQQESYLRGTGPYRVIVTRLRSGVHSLHRSSGRRKGKQPEECVCNVCSEDTRLEDVNHFLNECSKLDSERRAMWQAAIQAGAQDPDVASAYRWVAQTGALLNGVKMKLLLGWVPEAGHGVPARKHFAKLQKVLWKGLAAMWFKRSLVLAGRA